MPDALWYGQSGFRSEFGHLLGAMVGAAYFVSGRRSAKRSPGQPSAAGRPVGAGPRCVSERMRAPHNSPRSTGSSTALPADVGQWGLPDRDLHGPVPFIPVRPRPERVTLRTAMTILETIPAQRVTNMPGKDAEYRPNVDELSASPGVPATFGHHRLSEVSTLPIRSRSALRHTVHGRLR